MGLWQNDAYEILPLPKRGLRGISRRCINVEPTNSIATWSFTLRVCESVSDAIDGYHRAQLIYDPTNK
jgi:hypothetical protein